MRHESGGVTKLTFWKCLKPDDINWRLIYLPQSINNISNIWLMNWYEKCKSSYLFIDKFETTFISFSTRRKQHPSTGEKLINFHFHCYIAPKRIFALPRRQVWVWSFPVVGRCWQAHHHRASSSSSTTTTRQEVENLPSILFVCERPKDPVTIAFVLHLGSFCSPVDGKEK